MLQVKREHSWCCLAEREREQCPPQVSMVVEQLRLYDISQWNVPIRPSASAAAMLQNRSAVEGEISPVI